MLRLRAATHPAVPVGSSGVQPVPTEAKLLSDVPRPPHPEHQEPGHGESGLHAAVPMQGRSPLPPHRRRMTLTFALSSQFPAQLPRFATYYLRGVCTRVCLVTSQEHQNKMLKFDVMSRGVAPPFS